MSYRVTPLKKTKPEYEGLYKVTFYLPMEAISQIEHMAIRKCKTRPEEILSLIQDALKWRSQYRNNK